MDVCALGSIFAYCLCNVLKSECDNFCFLVTPGLSIPSSNLRAIMRTKWSRVKRASFSIGTSPHGVVKNKFLYCNQEFGLSCGTFLGRSDKQ